MNKLDLEVSIWKESSKTALPSPTTWKIQCLCHIVIPRAWYTLIFSETGKNVKRLLLCAGWRSFTRVIKKSRCYFFKHIPLFKILFVKSLKLMWTEVCNQSWGPRLLQWLCLSGWMWSKDCFACSLKAQNYHDSHAYDECICLTTTVGTSPFITLQGAFLFAFSHVVWLCIHNSILYNISCISL